MNVADVLIDKIIEKGNPTVVGLDPDIESIPSVYKNQSLNVGDVLCATSEVIFRYNKDIIDTVSPIVAAVKPQMAFYEQYGSAGVMAFEKTVLYAKEKGLVVIEDGKRNDIGHTAEAYAAGHLGKVKTIDGKKASSFDVDYLTVSPFLGIDSLMPFLDACSDGSKGIFILVKTSNSGSGELQNVKRDDGKTISQALAELVNCSGRPTIGHYGYSPIGAVVGATYPEEAKILREIMPNSLLLVPGYGAQGGDAKDILPCFDRFGLGAVVNSSRGILYSHMTEEQRKTCTREAYLTSVFESARKMRDDIKMALCGACPELVY